MILALFGLLALSAGGPTASAAGCDASCGPTPAAELSEADFAAWRGSYAQDPPAAPELALETLLFYGDQTRALLDRLGYGPLDAAHRAELDRELARDRVVVEMRLVDDDGIVRATLPPTEIPLRDKQHLSLEGTGSLGQLITGGKVKRVGLAHLWTRW